MPLCLLLFSVLINSSSYKVISSLKLRARSSNFLCQVLILFIYLFILGNCYGSLFLTRNKNYFAIIRTFFLTIVGYKLAIVSLCPAILTL